jgi:hypothetical protein
MRNFSGFGLGRNVSPTDTRDYALADYMPKDLGDLSGTVEWNYTGVLLDQGKTPHCPGFGAANFGNNPPIVDAFTNADGDKFYYMCKVIDGEPGQENGSNPRSVGKMLKQVGRINAYAFAANTDEMTYWLLHTGPVMCGTDWYDSMFTPDAQNIVCPTGKVAGGHFYIVNGTYGNRMYRIHNSWDDQWGIHGEAYISVPDMAFLLNNQGEAMTAVELPFGVGPSPKSDGCLIGLLKKLGLG